MSTTPTPNPFSMPMADLETAAGINQPAPVTPAPEPVAAPAVTPAAPAAPEWGQMAKGEDGTYQVTLATGEVFKGTADEVIQKQAEAHVQTKRWGQEWKQKADAATPAAPATPAPVAVDPAVQATRDWMLAEQAAALGMTAEEYKARVQMVFQTSDAMATNIAIADFHKMCPGYVDTPENSEAIKAYFPDNFDHFPTAQELKQAYALAVVDGKITPAAPQAAQPAQARPVPMPAANATQTAVNVDAWKMPLEDLAKAAGINQ